MTKTKTEVAVVPLQKQISTLSETDMNKLFNNPNSGIEAVEDRSIVPFPLQLGIVQKLTGDSLFVDPKKDNTRTNWGKIFVRPRKVKGADGNWSYEKQLTSNDLQDEMELTLLKVEFGVEIWRKEKKEGLDFPVTVTYARSKKMIKSHERDAWIERYNPDNDETGYRYTNQVRLILTPYTSKEVVEMVDKGENPFVTIALAGTDGWNTWQVINEGMTQAKKQFGVKGELKSVLSSLFKIKLSTSKTTSGANEYYIFNAKVIANDLQEAIRFEPLVNDLDREFTFFYNTQDQDPSLREVEITTEEVIDRTFDEDMEQAKEVGKEIELDDEIEDEDLPF